jgi:adenosylcobinamide-GDP ribazoletransferase
MFPLIGLLLGLLPAFVFMLAIWLHLNPFAAAIAALMVMLGLTGGRAEIATASILEALCRTGNRDTRVKILAETRPGYYGMFGLILLVLAKLALLGSVVSIWHGVGAILAAAAVSRGITAVATWFADSMDGDRIAGLELEPGRALVWIPALASVLLLVPLLWFWSGLVAIPLVIVATGLAFVGCRSAFGGLPVYSVGLLQQVAEVTILLAAVAHF